MELRQIEYMVAAARLRHFTRAAAELRVAQPALSQQIKGLERELGVALFERTTRQVRLTEAGSAFLARAQRILAEVENARVDMREFAGLARGRIVIGALQSLTELRLPALLAAFHALHPGIEIALREDTTEQLVTLLGAGQLDLALIHQGPGLYPADAALPPGLAAEPLLTEDLVVVVAPTHALASRQDVTLEELRAEPFIVFKPGSGLRYTLIQATAAAGFSPHVAFESGEMTTVRALAAAGLGVTLIPRSTAIAEGPAVAVVPLRSPSLTRTVSLAWREGRHRPAAAAFLVFARDYLHRTSTLP